MIFHRSCPVSFRLMPETDVFFIVTFPYLFNKIAALDNESQKLVQAALDELQKTNPRTTLTVAHRLMTIKDCDKIAFLGDGGVLEMGTHSELLDLKGHYYNLWIMQGSEEETQERKKEA